MLFRSLLVAGGLASIAAAPVARSQTLFTDVSTLSGINAVPHACLGINDAGPGMERMAPGGLIADLDNDGWNDILFVGGSAGRNCVFWNKANMRFDADTQTGIIVAHRSSGVAAGDIDNDGDLDIFMSAVGDTTDQGPGGNKLYINNGDRTFTDVTRTVGPADLTTNNPAAGDAYGVAFGDYDLDGDLDLFVSGWMGGNKLYRNDGPLSFTDVTSDIAVDLSTTNGFAPRFNDIDLDGDVDILLVADFNTSKLLENNGDNTFSDRTTPWQANQDSNGMGTTTGDFDNDGDTDWYVTSIGSLDGDRGSGNMLYLNDTVGKRFTEVSVPAGVNYGGWGWGASAFDADHDGWTDIAATNGWFSGYYPVDPTFFFKNNGPGGLGSITFTDATAASGLMDNYEARGLASGDLDNDGDVDFIVFGHSAPAVLYRNNTDDDRWIRFDLRTTGCGTLPPGGRHTLVVIYADGQKMSRYVDGGSNFVSQSELEVHFGIGDATQVERVEITWADGSRTVRRNMARGMTHTIVPRACASVFEMINMFGRGDPGADLDGDGVLTPADVNQIFRDAR